MRKNIYRATLAAMFLFAFVAVILAAWAPLELTLLALSLSLLALPIAIHAQLTMIFEALKQRRGGASVDPTGSHDLEKQIRALATDVQHLNSDRESMMRSAVDIRNESRALRAALIYSNQEQTKISES